MNVKYDYQREKDVWCISKFGSKSNNSPTPTNVYMSLISEYGKDFTDEKVSLFIDNYIKTHKIYIKESVKNFQSVWDEISKDYERIAEKVFKVSLPNKIVAYLTINERCPYSLEENHFFVHVPSEASNAVSMHELWHFYTWEKFGATEQNRIGHKMYNDIKESLTVLLNIECEELLPTGKQDCGYPQHKKIRNRIVELWSEEKNIDKLWEKLTTEYHLLIK